MSIIYNKVCKSGIVIDIVRPVGYSENKGGVS